jgi:hypothetical protein
LCRVLVERGEEGRTAQYVVHGLLLLKGSAVPRPV